MTFNLTIFKWHSSWPIWNDIQLDHFRMTFILTNLEWYSTWPFWNDIHPDQFGMTFNLTIFEWHLTWPFWMTFNLTIKSIIFHSFASNKELSMQIIRLWWCMCSLQRWHAAEYNTFNPYSGPSEESMIAEWQWCHRYAWLTIQVSILSADGTCCFLIHYYYKAWHSLVYSLWFCRH